MPTYPVIRGKMVRDRGLGGNITGGDPDTFEPDAWAYLVRAYAVKSMIDVGSGEGHAVKWFIDYGVNAFGIEGLPRNVENSVAPTVLHDLRNGPLITSPVNLAWCCEVVEHLHEKFLDNLITTLKNAKIIVITHATGSGYHHVNVKGHGYWIRAMRDRGCVFLPQGTKTLRSFAKHHFLQETGLVFSR